MPSIKCTIKAVERTHAGPKLVSALKIPRQCNSWNCTMKLGPQHDHPLLFAAKRGSKCTFESITGHSGGHFSQKSVQTASLITSFPTVCLLGKTDKFDFGSIFWSNFAQVLAVKSGFCALSLCILGVLAWNSAWGSSMMFWREWPWGLWSVLKPGHLCAF